MPAKKKFLTAIAALTVLWIAVAFASVFSGIYDAGIMETVTGGDRLASTIFYKIRIPRVLMATIAGGTFAICGAALQALFRNPLASPFTLGISGGASLGAIIAMRTGLAAGFLGEVPFFCLADGSIHRLDHGHKHEAVHDGLLCADFDAVGRRLITGGEDGKDCHTTPKTEPARKQREGIPGKWRHFSCLVSLNPMGPSMEPSSRMLMTWVPMGEEIFSFPSSTR